MTSWAVQWIRASLLSGTALVSLACAVGVEESTVFDPSGGAPVDDDGSEGDAPHATESSSRGDGGDTTAATVDPHEGSSDDAGTTAPRVARTSLHALTIRSRRSQTD